MGQKLYNYTTTRRILGGKTVDNIEKFIEHQKIIKEISQAFKEELLRRENEEILWNLREVKHDNTKPDEDNHRAIYDDKGEK